MVLQEQQQNKKNLKKKKGGGGSPAIDPAECRGASAGKWVRQERYRGEVALAELAHLT